ncbi:MAG: hypothetical protein KGJ86_00035 [Chloroflexota bacterium]|nr:hypothetical protein [Chloroflexota bacterium]
MPEDNKNDDIPVPLLIDALKGGCHQPVFIETFWKAEDEDMAHCFLSNVRNWPNLVAGAASIKVNPPPENN